MFVDIVRELDINNIDKTLMHHMAKIYEENLPDSLYLNHYQLEEQYGHPPDKWKKFLKIKEVDRLVESEMVQIAEIAARQALARLQSGKAASADIQAAKELLSTSRLLKQKTNQRPQMIITRIPGKTHGE